MTRQHDAPTVNEVAGIAAKLLGRSVDYITRFSPTHGGSASFSYRCQLAGRELLIKINKRANQPIGVYYHRRLMEAGVPVPELIAFDADAGRQGQGCAIFEWVEGVPAEFDCASGPPYDEAELGQILRAVHDLAHHDGFGPLDDAGRGSSRTWSEALLSTWHIARCVERGAFDSNLAARLRALPQRFDTELASARTGLIHYEDIMFNGNLIVGGNRRIAAVLDFAGAIAGDPMWELMWFDYYFGEYGYYQRTAASFSLARFRCAYGIEYDPRAPLQRLYLISAVLEKLSFLPLHDPRAAHHRSMLAELVAELEN